VTPFFMSVGPPGAGRFAFDAVFEVRGESLDAWRSGSIRCEKAPDGAGFGGGQPIRLGEIPEVAPAFTQDAP
jgi:hypothetical protein